MRSWARVRARARRCAATPPQAERLLQRRHALLGQTQALCGELTGALTDLAEDESWARGQCQAMQAKLDEGLSGAACAR